MAATQQSAGSRMPPLVASLCMISVSSVGLSAASTRTGHSSAAPGAAREMMAFASAASVVVSIPGTSRAASTCPLKIMLQLRPSGRGRSVAPMHMRGGGDDEVRAIIEKTRSDAAKNVPFSEEELNRAVRSLKLLLASELDAETAIDWAAYRSLLAKTAHLSHKNWDTTSESAHALAGIVKGPGDAVFKRLFERVLGDGNWDAAAAAASTRPTASKPWAVLVTGVNGIRKTSSVYQAWFKEALKKSLAEQYPGEEAELPDGSDSFFRQLDYMIATVANEDFKALYSVEDIGLYAALKDSIFTRYRTLAEMLGVLLLHEAQRRRLNVMVETSGRDVAMFKYIDTFFPEETYRKLVVHFSINDISYAERSVDSRMAKEMKDGRAAASGSTLSMIRANAGGPYGSAVLKGVQADSQKVWEGIKGGGEGVGVTWFKAGISIEGGDEEWKVRANGLEEVYLFGAPRH